MSNVENKFDFDNEVSFESKANRLASLVKREGYLNHLCPLCLHKKIRGKDCHETPKKKRRK